ncbi:MAG: putative selenium-dependent hydroxylase accessory protein YqeC [Oscillibacter sp.]|nr:putative selenium-dependent hydroxylase accessory protein YqeC [Oscillibacter sp.]
MELWELLEIRPGVTALIGGGGKTTAMYTLARELAAKGTVICTTTTHILPPEHLPLRNNSDERELASALSVQRCICMGTPSGYGKLTAPTLPMETLAALADYVLVEADGSKRLPVKAHLSHEPVIPANAVQTVIMVGASGIGRPVREMVHRWEQFCRHTGALPEDPVTAENLARLLTAENIGGKIFINQAETPEALTAACRLAELLPRPVYAGSLKGGTWTCLS